jgi:hypothetical protein
MRKVREGRETDDRVKGDILNQDYAFLKNPDQADELRVSVSTSGLGFQFKCFAEIPASRIEDYRDYRARAKTSFGSFDEEKTSDGDSYRVWFLLRDFDIEETKSHYINNYYEVRKASSRKT